MVPTATLTVLLRHGSSAVGTTEQVVKELLCLCLVRVGGMQRDARSVKGRDKADLIPLVKIRGAAPISAVSPIADHDGRFS